MIAEIILLKYSDLKKRYKNFREEQIFRFIKKKMYKFCVINKMYF